MSDTVKLYKCYKGTCSRCLSEDNPFITEDEYKDFLDIDGKLQCPEGHLDCGIQELKPEDFPKPPTDNKKKIVIAASIVGLLVLLGIGGYGYYWFTKVKTTAETATNVTNTVSELAKDMAVTNAVKGAIKETASTINENSKESSVAEKEAPATPAKPAKTTLTPEVSATANSIQECFDKLSSSKISYSSKDQLVNTTLEYFTSPSAKVTTMGVNSTDVDEMPVKSFLETMRTLNRHYTFVNGQKSGDKYSSITVKAE